MINTFYLMAVTGLRPQLDIQIDLVIQEPGKDLTLG